MSTSTAVVRLDELATQRRALTDQFAALTAEYRHQLAHIDVAIGDVKAEEKVPWSFVGTVLGVSGQRAGLRTAVAHAELCGQPEAVSPS